MSKETASTPRQQRFLEALATLKLEFPVAEISRRTGYAEGTVSPNLKPTTEAPTKFIRRVSEAFNLDAEAIITGVPGNDTKKPDTEASGDNQDKYQAKYIALLERQESRSMDIVESAAKAAVDRLAANYATKDEVGEIRSSLGTVQKLVAENHVLIRSLEKFAAFHSGKVAGKTPEQIAGILQGIREQIEHGKPSGKKKIVGN